MQCLTITKPMAIKIKNGSTIIKNNAKIIIVIEVMNMMKMLIMMKMLAIVMIIDVLMLITILNKR